MDPTAELFLMSIAMFAGCYAAGKLPLILQSRENKNQLMSVLGAGMLVGTAFAVIIPEGIRMLYIDCGAVAPASPTQKVDPAGGVVVVTGHTHSGPGKDKEVIIALSLLFGFLFMLLVDKCACHQSNKGDAEAGGGGGGGNGGGRRVCTATLGLIVHAAADGIALGAAAASHHADVEVIVFLAIMLHKAPTAFGLTSFLVREGSDYRRVNRLLLLFSAAAPAGAFATHAIITMSGTESMSGSESTSIAMLFSAGTFLYVSTVHIIPELMSSSGGDSGDSSTGSGQLSFKQLSVLIFGAFIPLLFSLGHHH